MVYLEALEATQYLSQSHLQVAVVAVVKVRTLQQLVAQVAAEAATVQQV
jgi:transketolase C-terminal domain/subunit